MNPYKHYTITAILVALVLAIMPGCGTVKETLYDEQQTQVGTVGQDSVMISDTEYISVEEFVAQGGNVEELPSDKYLPAGTPIYETTYVPSRIAEKGISATRAIPSFGGLIELILGGAVTIGGVLLGKSRSKWKKAAESTIIGIDTFRDVLDQTPQGEKIDAVLKETLSGSHYKAGVFDAVQKVLARYKTPDKKPIELN